MNPLSLEAFAAWLEQQPADKRYVYVDSKKCACGQYAQSLGMKSNVATDYGNREEWRIAYHAGDPFWTKADALAMQSDSDFEWTFGALAKRVKKEIEGNLATRLRSRLYRLAQAIQR